MGVMLLVITKSLNGQVFRNTHALALNGTEGVATQQDVSQAIGFPFLDSTGGLLPPDAFGSEQGPIWAVLEFERLMYSSLVRFERLLITDRKNYAPGPDQERAFKSYALNYTGSTNRSTPQSLDAGDHILSITRRAAGVSAEDGEIEFRNLLNKDEFINSGRRMLDWSSQQARQAIADLMADAIAGSGIDQLFYGSTGAAARGYVIPSYANADSPGIRKGDLTGGYPCEGFAIYGPLSRQVRQGRKKKEKTTP